MGNIKHVTTVTPVEEILNILDEDAGVIIDDFLESADLAQIKKDLRPFLTVTNNGQDEFTGFETKSCLLYTSPSPRDGLLSRMPSSA